MTVTIELDADFVHDTHGLCQELRAEAAVHPVLFEIDRVMEHAIASRVCR